MRARGMIVLVAVLASAACTSTADVAPPSSETQARLERDAAAVRLCGDEAERLAESGGNPRLAWVLVASEPADTRGRVFCHYDVDGYPAPMPPPPPGAEGRAYRRVTIESVEDGAVTLLSARFDREKPQERPGTRLIRIDPAEEG